MTHFDFDHLVIGSGFGGSVAALRLAERGYSVGVLEAGRRFADDELPRSTMDLRRYFFAPRFGMRGILRMTLFRDVFIMSGAGVGGGSLGYANTLYRPPAAFYEDPQWRGLDEDWGSTLAEHYDEAERMLGVATVATDDAADDLLRAFGDAIGVGGTYAKTRVGVHFGEGPGVVSPDPYFGGAGPDRAGCTNCGRCMVGCPVGAKNTLVKNYLHLAERLGVQIRDSTEVLDIAPLGDGTGADGYAVTVRRSGAVLRRRRTEVLRAKEVTVSAGALGSTTLLHRCRLVGGLPRLSDRLGELVRTNSEAILAVTLPEERPGMNERVAISGSIFPDARTHIETVSYGGKGDSMRLLTTLLTGDGTRVTRPLKLLRELARHPRRWWSLLRDPDWSQRTIILLVMQSLDNAMALRATPTRRGGIRVRTEQDPEKPNPTFIPVANQAAAWIAEQTGGIAQSGFTEALLNVPATAHVLGGAVMGSGPYDGVVDREGRAFGYVGLRVLDGSIVPANIGVNPSLTITALAEHAMSHVAPKGLEGLPMATPSLDIVDGTRVPMSA